MAAARAGRGPAIRGAGPHSGSPPGGLRLAASATRRRLVRRYRQGAAGLPAHLEDYGFGATQDIVVVHEPEAPDTSGMLQALQPRYLPPIVVLFLPADDGGGWRLAPDHTAPCAAIAEADLPGR